MRAWTNGLAPGHGRDGAGRLVVGGIDARELIETYGTPVIVVDFGPIERAVEAFCKASAEHSTGVSYAAKAFVCDELVRLLQRRGLGIDVGSLGELAAVEATGFPSARITLHGAGKTDAELRAVLAGRVGRVVLDGVSDARRLAELSVQGGTAAVLLRLNTGVDVATHDHVRTVGDDAKFGMTRDEEAEAVAILRAAPALRFAGLHAHAGSQIADPAAFVANASELLAAARRFSGYGFEARTLVAGGGFGVQYDPVRPQDEIDIAHAIAACARRVAEERSTPSPALEFEPGRSIVAHAGTTLYEVLAVKRRPSGDIVVVDGGMADNPRPMLYGAYHHVVAVHDDDANRGPADVFGRACESDYIGRAELPQHLERGDFVAVCTTGAYTYSMASNYNGFPKPALAGVRERTHARLLASLDGAKEMALRQQSAF